MAWVVTAVVAAVTVGSAAYEAHEARNAADDAKQQAKEDRADALRAEQFAETEGEGQGSLGNVSLAIDEDVSSEVMSGTSNISI